MKSLYAIIVLSILAVGAWFYVYITTPAPYNPPSNTSPVTTKPSTPKPTKPVVTPPTPTTPEPTEPEPTEPTPTKPSQPGTPLPTSVTLPIQFASQAPTGSWDYPYQEFCEEASSLMAAFYALGKSMPSRSGIDQELLRIQAWEEKTFGYYEDTTAAETAKLLREFYNLDNVTLLQNPSVTDLKTALSEKKAIVVPAAGRMLGSPYYRAPGPLYHMIVLKGYTADGYFISQDPGTNTKGENYKFKIETIMNAIHDWNDGDVDNGKKVVILVGKQD